MHTLCIDYLSASITRRHAVSPIVDVDKCVDISHLLRLQLRFTYQDNPKMCCKGRNFCSIIVTNQRYVPSSPLSLMATRCLYAQTYVHKEIKIIKIIHSILFKLPVVGLNLRVLAAPKKICAVLVSGLTNSKLL